MGSEPVVHLDNARRDGSRGPSPELVRFPPARRRQPGSRTAPLRVVIGEREALLREGLALIVRRAGFALVDAVDDVGTLPAVVASLRPDLVITGRHGPSGRADDGLRAAVAIRRRMPGTGVLVLAQQVDRRNLGDLLGDRPVGVGYMVKHRISDVAAFLHAMRTVAAGGAVLEPEVAELVLRRSSRDDPVLVLLTPRQREILALMAEGLSNAGIAARLHLSEKTVVHHCSAIYAAMDLTPTAHEHRRVLAVVRHLTAQAAARPASERRTGLSEFGPRASATRSGAAR